MSKPKVSIGMPVYNGERYVVQAIESILSQTFTDLELIISDNASTDRTREICEGFAARDSRVTFFRQPSNLGPIRNYDAVFQAARGEYFKWAAADDVIEPTFIEKCAHVLDTNPACVLAYPKAKFIDQNGDFFQDYDVKLATDVASPARRFNAIATADHKITHNFEIFGLFRKAMGDLIPPQGGYAGADRVYLARLALYGTFIEVPEILFLSREHAEQSIHTLPAYLQKKKTWITKLIGHGQLPPAEWFDPKYTGKITFPEWRLLREYLISIEYGGLTMGQKIQCIGAAFNRQLHHGNWARLGRDFLLAGDKMIARMAQKVRKPESQPTPSPESPSKSRAAA